MSTPSPYQRFTVPLRSLIEQFAERMQLVAGPSIGLTIFGPAVTGSIRSGTRIESVLLLESIDLTMLRRLASAGAQSHAEHFAPPLVMTRPSLLSSRDTFPLELLAIQQQHVTVLGDDVFDGLTFEPRDMRLECERELRTMLLAMRQALLVSGGDETSLDALQRHAEMGLLRILRGLLWLKGQKHAPMPEQTLIEMEALARRPLLGVRAAIEHGGGRGWQHFRLLYDDLDALGNLTDAW
jgi:hypothetical protein